MLLLKNNSDFLRIRTGFNDKGTMKTVPETWEHVLLSTATRDLNSATGWAKTLKGLPVSSKCNSKRPKKFGHLLVMFYVYCSLLPWKQGSFICASASYNLHFYSNDIQRFFFFMLHICFLCWGQYTRDSMVSWHTLLERERAKNKQSCWKRSDSCSEMN